MRRILKSTTVPVSLVGLTPPSSATDINPDLYGGKDVKERLGQDQHLKCIYCECKLNGDYGHIEHFRPKKGYSIPPSNQLHRPGYYWLAYDWQNLLLSCSKCNTSYKANHFALEDESKRDIPHCDISGEVPLLVNPSTEESALFIEFHQHIVVPRMIDGIESPKGRYTIDLLQLNHRRDLLANRREVWDKFEHWKKVVKVALEMIDQEKCVDQANELLILAKNEMALMKSEEAEYSAMFL